MNRANLYAMILAAACGPLIGAAHAADLQADLVRAVGADDIDGVKKLIAQGADVNFNYAQFSGGVLGYAAIKSKGGKDCIPMVKTLMAAGARPALVDLTYSAMELGHEPAVVNLLLTDASLREQVKHSKDVLNHFAADKHSAGAPDAEIVAALIKAGADPNKHDVIGARPLDWAEINSNEEIAKALIAGGAEVNFHFDQNDVTPLIEAATIHADGKEHPEMVKDLLAAGARVDDANERGETALMRATRTASTRTMKLLLEAGADPGAKDQIGETPLYVAETGPDFVKDMLKEYVEKRKNGFLPAATQTAPQSAPAAGPAVAAAPAPAAQPSVDAPSYGMPEDLHKFALVVGIEKYKSLPPAEFAESDAAAVRRHLKALGYPERNIIYLTGDNAGKSGLEKYLDSWLPRNLNEDSQFLFYFSGHGAPDPSTGQAYLVPWDGDPKFLEDTGYPIQKLYAQLGKLKSRHIIVALDSCFSGAGGRSVLAKGARPLVNRVVGLDDAKSGNLTILTAASGDEITGTEEGQSHGLFTYYLLKALNEKKGRTNARELFDYLKPLVQDDARRDNRDQTPMFFAPGAAKSADPARL